MNKVKFLSIVVVGLLLSNIALVGFLVLKKPSHPKHFGPRNTIVEKLSFDKNQEKAYDKLIEGHRNEITKTENEILLLKNKLYSNLSVDPQSNTKDSLINELSKVQIKIENIHYKHFEDIKQLCHDDQKQAYVNLTTEIASLFAHPPIKGKK